MLRASWCFWLSGVVAAAVAAAAPAMAQSAPSFETLIQSIRLSIENGRYSEAEEQADVLFRASRGTVSDPLLQAAVGDLLIDALVRNGRGAEARTRELAEEMVRARPSIVGHDHPLVATSLRNLGAVLYQTGDYSLAIARLREAVAIREMTASSNVSEMADDLDHLARALAEVDRYDEALGYSNRALALREMGGGVDAGVARTLHVRGLVWQSKGDYPRAHSDLERALALHEAVHPAHPETAMALAQLGEQLGLEGALARAREFVGRASVLAEATLRPDHPDVASCLRSLASILQELGDLSGSRSIRERGLAVAEKSLGPDHPKVAVQLNDLANTLLLQGEYSTARTFYERARDMYERRLGSDDNSVTTASYNLALLYTRLGDLQEARREFQRVISTWERVIGRDHPNVARALSALAEALAEQGLDGEAQTVFQRALTIRERALGVEHPYVARTLSQMSASLARLGQVRRALELSERSLRIWERTGAQEGLAEALVIHGRILRDRGDFVGAGQTYETALDIRRTLLGSSHSLTAEAEVNLAAVQAQLHNRKEAFVSALRGEETSRSHLRLTLGSLAERQALDYAASRPRGLDLAISLVSDANPATRVLDALILSRSLTLDEIGSRQRSFADSTTTPLWTALTSARQRLANLVIRGPGQQQPEQYRALVDDARREKEQAERALAERSAAFSSQLARAEIGIDQVRTALPVNGALVSFVRYDRTIFPDAPTGTQSGPARTTQSVPSYVAFVLRPGMAEPAVVRLGRAATIETQIARWRSELIAGIAKPTASPPETEKAFRVVGTSLRQRVWDPIAAHLQGVNRVFIVPDGAINLVPLAALPVGQSRYLLEDGPVIHYLSAERDLVPAERPTRTAGEGLLAVGGPAFADGTVFASLAKPNVTPTTKEVTRSAASAETGATPEQRVATVASTSFRSTGSKCSSFQSMRFPALPGSGREVEDVANLWRGLGTADNAGKMSAQTLTGRDASEQAVKQLGPGRRILHLATHGYFLGDECASALDGTRAVGGLAPSGAGKTTSRARSARRTELPENPLLLSGLAFAGANRRAAAGPEEDDGILTAEEVASLNLEGVEWAVLSACDTGLGQLRAGEGVFGLRRAFQVAGARTIIMSLWSVEDQAARSWMRALYEGRLERRLDTADAVREASLTVLRQRRAKGLSTHAFYWAGFVAAGDWR